MATSDGFPTAIIVSFVVFYSVVFLFSAVGNTVVICASYLKLKRGQRSINAFIANLAIADLTFTVLSTLNFVNFLWAWPGGTVSCKVQGFLIEVCYTSSIMTLTLISFERRKAVITPLRVRTSSHNEYIKLITLWIASLVIGSPLLLAYDINKDASGSLICNNASFGNLGKQVYYSIHTVFVFIVPLTYMLYAQFTTFNALRTRVFLTPHAFSTASSKRHRKVAKILVTLTAAFIVCWTPFIAIRLMMYHHLTDEGYFWRASQLLIFLNTALDPLLYGIYGENNGRFIQRFNCKRAAVHAANTRTTEQSSQLHQASQK